MQLRSNEVEATFQGGVAMVSNIGESRDFTTRKVLICLTEEMIRDLDENAYRTDVGNRSAVVRRACSEYLERHGGSHWDME